MSTKGLPSEVKAAINENTGIIYDNRTTQETREAAEKDNAKIFREYGKTARQHFNSIIGKIKQGAAEDKKLDAAANKLNSGGEPSKKSKKKDKIAIMIAVGKPKMAYGGSVKGKKHFYSTGGVAIDNLPNKGTRELAKTTKGRQALRNMGLLKNGNKTT